MRLDARLDLGRRLAVPMVILGLVGCSPDGPGSSEGAVEAPVEAGATPSEAEPSPEDPGAPTESAGLPGADPAPEALGVPAESASPTGPEEVPDDLGALLLSVPPTGSIRDAVSLAALERVSGMDVFVAGPHREGAFDFRSTSDFGRYNPEFLRWFIDTLFGEGRSADLLERLAERLPLFDAYLHRLYSLSAARCAIGAEPASFERFKEEYRQVTETGRAFSAYGAFASWNGPSGGYNAEDLAFWARRDRDGTSDIVAEGLRRALEAFAFPTYQGRVGCMSESDGAAALPAFFVEDSFLDHEAWGDPSALECREELLTQRYGSAWPQAADIDSAEEAPIQGREAILEALTSAGCPESLVTGPHYALVRDGARARWEPVELDFSLEFYAPEAACAPERIVALRVEPAGAPDPILLRAGHPASSVGYLRDTEERDAPGTDATRVTFADTPGLAGLYKTHERTTFVEEAGSERTVVSRTTLWAEFDDGRTTKLEERHGVGKYTYSEPAIQNIVILDVNGDDEPDFLYDIDNLGRRLVMTRGGEILRVVPLITDEYSGVGGC